MKNILSWCLERFFNCSLVLIQKTPRYVFSMLFKSNCSHLFSPKGSYLCHITPQIKSSVTLEGRIELKIDDISELGVAIWKEAKREKPSKDYDTRRAQKGAEMLSVLQHNLLITKSVCLSLLLLLTNVRQKIKRLLVLESSIVILLFIMLLPLSVTYTL
jgi:hypothetical protein